MSGWFRIGDEDSEIWKLNSPESSGGVVWFDGSLGGRVVFVLLPVLL